MDSKIFALLIPIMALAIPVSAIILGGLHKISKTRLEEARIRAGSLGDGAESELAQLRGDVDQLRSELGEVHERLDFTERLLARNAEKPSLKSGTE